MPFFVGLQSFSPPPLRKCSRRSTRQTFCHSEVIAIFFVGAFCQPPPPPPWLPPPPPPPSLSALLELLAPPPPPEAGFFSSSAKEKSRPPFRASSSSAALARSAAAAAGPRERPLSPGFRPPSPSSPFGKYHSRTSSCETGGEWVRKSFGLRAREEEG